MENKILIFTCIDYIKDNCIYDFLDDFFQEYASYDYESFIDKLCKIDKGLNRRGARHGKCEWLGRVGFVCANLLLYFVCCRGS